MVIGSLTALNYGAAAVYPCEGFDAKMALEAVSQEGCHSIYGVPTMFNAYVNEYLANKEKYNIETLDRGIMAGSICPEELMKQCNRELGIDYLSI